ncbi:MAG: hypothetical protein KA521_11550 [Crocinitomicaceae bacterium]|jgi:hypothetical protein|nr:hypothetical protein [Crocinitomicaceae bacterium]
MKLSKFILSFLLSFGFGVDSYAQIERFAFQDTLNEYFYLESFQEMEMKKLFLSEKFDSSLNSSRSSFMAIISYSGPSSICPGQSVVLTGNGQKGCNYLWTTGQTTKSITVTQPGTYGLTLNCYKCYYGIYIANPITIGGNTLITDLNTDGVVDVLDYIIFLGEYLTPCPGCPQDFYPDGFVDTRDYLIWVADIFKTCN